MDNNFKILLNSKSLQRFLNFILFKLFFGLVFYWLIIKLSYTIGLDFEFYLSDYIKFFLLSTILVISKLFVFAKYDFPYSYVGQVVKLVLEPNIQTFFIIFGSGIYYLMISLLYHNGSVNTILAYS
jgi:hypothetical protein